MQKPIIISYYTLNSPYEREIVALKDSAKRFNLDTHIIGIHSLGSWEKNCCFKPHFILETLMYYKRPILWLDADAVILQEPTQSYYWTYPFATRINPSLDLYHPSKCITGTVYAQYQPLTLQLIQDWEKECQKQLKEKKEGNPVWDQICLRDVLTEKNLWDFVSAVPLSYGAIIHHEEEVSDAVIMHHQASRTYKPLMDGEINPLFSFEIDSLNGYELKQFRQQKPH